MRGKTTLFSAAVILLFLSSPVFAYRQVIDLGTLGGTYQYSKATSINDNGQVVGYAYTDTQDISGIRRACLFDSTGGGANTYLGTLGGTQSCAYSINNNGKIVGNATPVGDGSTPMSSTSACLFDSTNSGNNKNLGSLSAFSSTGSAYCINNNGYIVGQASKSVISGGVILSSLTACYFDQTTPWSNFDLGAKLAYSINNNNQIVGYANSSGRSRACLFDPPNGTNNIDLGTFGGDYSIAYSTNDSGLIVGQADYSTVYTPIFRSYYHACIFDASGNGDNTDLGTLGGAMSAALFANNENQIVGYASDGSGQRKACLFDSTGQGNNTNLNDLIDPSSGWILKEASCINNNGWIVGYGTHNGIDHAFLLTPEPTTVLLFGLGGFVLRKRKSY
jgi:probable HAF family extracellular repeat protein